MRAIFDAARRGPERLPPARRRSPERITDYVAGMTDRFALAYAEAGVGSRGGAHQGRRASPRSRRRPTSWTSSRRGPRSAGLGPRYTGRCPFHEERTASFSVDPVDKLYHCFGCGKGGDVVRFVRESENLDFAGAIEWLADRFRVTLEYEESSPREDEARRRRERLTALLDQATAYFERVLWDTEAGGPVREYLASRGLGEEIAREFRLGLSPGVGLVAKARERGFTADEIRAAGLANQRGNDYFPFRLMFPLADARGRDRSVPGAAAPGRRPAERQVRQHAGERALQEGQRPVRPPLRASHDRQAGPRDRRRGQHRRDRAAAGRGRAGRRVDGHRAHREPAPGARPADEAPLSSASTPTRPGRRRRCVGWSSPWAGVRRPGRRAAEGAGSGRRAGRVRSAARHGGELPPLPRPDRARPGGRPPGGLRSRARDPARRGLARAQEALRLLADRLDLPRETLAGLASADLARPDDGGRRCRGPDAAILEAGLQRERDLLAAVVRNPSLVPELAGADARPFRRRAAPRLPRPARVRRGPRTRRSSRFARSLSLAPTETRSTSEPARSSSRLHERRSSRPPGSRPRAGDGAPGEGSPKCTRRSPRSSDLARERDSAGAESRGDPRLRRGRSRRRPLSRPQVPV